MTPTDEKLIFMLPETYVIQKLVKNGKNTRFSTTSGLAGSDDVGRILTTPVDEAWHFEQLCFFDVLQILNTFWDIKKKLSAPQGPSF